jgi:hypothetical protein
VKQLLEAHFVNGIDAMKKKEAESRARKRSELYIDATR